MALPSASLGFCCFLAFALLLVPGALAATKSIRSANEVMEPALVDSLVERTSTSTWLHELTHRVVQHRSLQVAGPPCNNQCDMNQQLLKKVNELRASRGVRPLCLNNKLILAAADHCQDMYSRNYFSHTGSDGSQPWDRMRRRGFVWSSAAENIAKGQQSVDQVFSSWFNSPGHFTNMVSSGNTFTGAYFFNGYWTQVFGASSSEACNNAGPGSQPSPAPVPQGGGGGCIALCDMNRRMAQLINAKRQASGIATVCINNKLILAAMDHARDMSNTGRLSTTGSDGSTTGSRISKRGFSWTNASGFFGQGYSCVDSFFNSFSPSSNMFNGQLRFIGVYQVGAFWNLVVASSTSEQCNN